MHYSTHLLRHLRHTIGQNIHHHRSRQRLPLRKLSQATGIPEQQLDHYEIGKREIRLDEALKIACALGLDMQDLITE